MSRCAKRCGGAKIALATNDAPGELRQVWVLLRAVDNAARTSGFQARSAFLGTHLSYSPSIHRSFGKFVPFYNLVMNRLVRSRRKVYRQLLAHARRQPHQECCGILAGQDEIITGAFPAKNGAADPVRNYEIAPQEMLHVLGELRQRRLEFLGIYHSHPHWLDINEPSCKDIALAHNSIPIHFIVTPRPYATTPIRAFSIRDGRATELEIELLP